MGVVAGENHRKIQGTGTQGAWKYSNRSSMVIFFGASQRCSYWCVNCIALQAWFHLYRMLIGTDPKHATPSVTAVEALPVLEDFIRVGPGGCCACGSVGALLEAWVALVSPSLSLMVSPLQFVLAGLLHW